MHEYKKKINRKSLILFVKSFQWLLLKMRKKVIHKENVIDLQNEIQVIISSSIIYI